MLLQTIGLYSKVMLWRSHVFFDCVSKLVSLFKCTLFGTIYVIMTLSNFSNDTIEIYSHPKNTFKRMSFNTKYFNKCFRTLEWNWIACHALAYANSIMQLNEVNRLVILLTLNELCNLLPWIAWKASEYFLDWNINGFKFSTRYKCKC